MSKQYFIASIFLFFLLLCSSAHASDATKEAGKTPIVITSESLTADKKNGTAVFEGSVIAKSGDITMNSDSMTVFYDDTGTGIKKIFAKGNVKAYNDEKSIFSDEATYFDDEEKIIFSGDPKAVEGENVITGTTITFYIRSNRAVVEGSKMILQNSKEQK